LSAEQFAVADAYFDDLKEAIEEARHRRARHTEGVITRVQRSPYGGYRVRSMPAEFVVDLMADGIPLPWERRQPELKEID